MRAVLGYGQRLAMLLDTQPPTKHGTTREFANYGTADCSYMWPFHGVCTDGRSFHNNRGSARRRCRGLLACDDLADAVKYHVIPVAKAMNMDLEAGGQKVGDPRGSVLTVTVADDKDTVNDVARYSCGCCYRQWCDLLH